MVFKYCHFNWSINKRRTGNKTPCLLTMMRGDVVVVKISFLIFNRNNDVWHPFYVCILQGSKVILMPEIEKKGNITCIKLYTYCPTLIQLCCCKRLKWELMILFWECWYYVHDNNVWDNKTKIMRFPFQMPHIFVLTFVDCCQNNETS